LLLLGLALDLLLLDGGFGARLGGGLLGSGLFGGAGRLAGRLAGLGGRPRRVVDLRVLAAEALGVGVVREAGHVHVEGGIDLVQNERLSFRVEVEDILAIGCVSRAAEGVFVVVVGVCEVVRGCLAGNGWL
jgi:hypothetical protein